MRRFWVFSLTCVLLLGTPVRSQAGILETIVLGCGKWLAMRVAAHTYGEWKARFLETEDPSTAMLSDEEFLLRAVRGLKIDGGTFFLPENHDNLMQICGGHAYVELMLHCQVCGLNYVHLVSPNYKTMLPTSKRSTYDWDKRLKGWDPKKMPGTFDMELTREMYQELRFWIGPSYFVFRRGAKEPIGYVEWVVVEQLPPAGRPIIENPLTAQTRTAKVNLRVHRVTGKDQYTPIASCSHGDWQTVGLPASP